MKKAVSIVTLVALALGGGMYYLVKSGIYPAWYQKHFVANSLTLQKQQIEGMKSSIKSLIDRRNEKYVHPLSINQVTLVGATDDPHQLPLRLAALQKTFPNAKIFVLEKNQEDTAKAKELLKSYDIDLNRIKFVARDFNPKEPHEVDLIFLESTYNGKLPSGMSYLQIRNRFDNKHADDEETITMHDGRIMIYREARHSVNPEEQKNK